MIKDRKEMINEADMLKGNINRMCVTTDDEELDVMYTFAKLRLEEIYEYNKNRFENKTL